MSDESIDGEHGIDRRTVLGSLAAGAAGMDGLVAGVADDSAARQLADQP